MAGNIPIGNVICRDGWGAARLLLELCKQDASDPEMRDLAHFLRQKSRGGDKEFAQMVVQFVQDNIAFVREQGEIFQGPAYTLASGAGDCDDHVRLTYGLASAGGLPARLAFLSKKGAPGPSHVVAQIGVPGEGWTWAETTIAADFGENPIDAAKRLGAVREDLDPSTLEVNVMEGLGVLTANLSDAFFQVLAAWERNTGGDGDGALALMMHESGLNPSSINDDGCAGINQFCPGTLKSYFKGTPQAYRNLSSEEQLKTAIRFWTDLNRASPGAILSGRDLYWANFLPAGVRPGAPDSYVVAGPGMMVGPLHGEDIVRKNPSLSKDKRTIYARDIQDVISAEKKKAKFKEASSRLANARGGKTAPSNLVAGGGSFLFGALAVLVMGGAGFLTASKMKL